MRQQAARQPGNRAAVLRVQAIGLSGCQAARLSGCQAIRRLLVIFYLAYCPHLYHNGYMKVAAHFIHVRGPQNPHRLVNVGWTVSFTVFV